MLSGLGEFLRQQQQYYPVPPQPQPQLEILSSWYFFRILCDCPARPVQIILQNKTATEPPSTWKGLGGFHK